MPAPVLVDRQPLSSELVLRSIVNRTRSNFALLDHYGELPKASLTAGIPMNMRTRREMTENNNQVGSMFCEIHTNIADPVERLAAVHQSAIAAKESNAENPMVEVLRVAGAQMVRYHAMGLLTPGCGAFHLVYSCNGLVTITVLADRDTVPDPEFYRQCLEESFAETLSAASGVAGARASESGKSRQLAKRRRKRKLAKISLPPT